MSAITWGIAANGQETAILARWVAEHIWPGRNREFGNCRGMAVIDGDELIAGIVYHNYEPDAQIIEISAASISKRWLTKETLRVMFQMPFRDFGCQALVMRVAPADKPLHRMLKAYGFEMYVLPRLRGRDEDEHVFILTDDAWASNKFNRKGD
jgi:RimJ/RimL family protein N-acetyltransferase